MARKDKREVIGIDKFLSLVDDGLSSQSRFYVEFSPPSGISGSIPDITIDTRALNIKQDYQQLNSNGKLNLFCHTTTLPSRELSTFTHNQVATPREIPISQVFAPVQMAFFIDKKHKIRNWFSGWQSLAINTKSNTLNFYDEYIADILISQIDKEGFTSNTVKLVGAYPSHVGVVDYSYEATNSLAQCPVTFNYHYAEIVDD